MLGTGLSQLIPVLFSPFLARIYSPADFGNLAIFMAISILAAMVSSGLYEFGIVLPKVDNDAKNLLGGIVLLSSLFFVISSIGSIVAVQYFNYETFYYLVPFSIFFTVSLNVLSYWYNRFRKYKLLNFVRIFQAVVIVGGSFLFSGFGSFGLIYGYVAGGFLVFSIFTVLFLKNIPEMNWVDMKKQLILHSKFPKIMLPSSLMNTFSSYGPVFFIKRFYNSFTLGSYSMTSRVLTAPSSVISTAVGQIFFKDISEQHQNGDIVGIRKQFYYSTLVLGAISVVCFLPLFFFGKELMVFVFGTEWNNAGGYMEIIAIGSIVKFVVSPLSIILIVLGRINKLATWQTLYFCTTILVFVIGGFFSIKTLLWIYTMHEIVLYLLYFWIINRTLKL